MLQDCLGRAGKGMWAHACACRGTGRLDRPRMDSTRTKVPGTADPDRRGGSRGAGDEGEQVCAMLCTRGGWPGRRRGVTSGGGLQAVLDAAVKVL